jgi:tocopherol O-methyltransferase
MIRGGAFGPVNEQVAAHYDELDLFYREIWGEHVHHGYWATGRETPSEAAEALVKLVADHLSLAPGQSVCDIGCGYGATAEALAAAYDVAVTGVTLSPVQAERAIRRRPARGRLSVRREDWTQNSLPSGSFERAYAIESSEHMEDKQGFCDEAFRTLRPGGLLVVCAWLACPAAPAWARRLLLEPICREGRLPSLGDRADYEGFLGKAGFDLLSAEDITGRVARTWSVCLRRLALKAVTDRRYMRFMLDRSARNRIFLLTILRLLIAFRTGAMRYCVFVARRPHDPFNKQATRDGHRGIMVKSPDAPAGAHRHAAPLGMHPRPRHRRTRVRHARPRRSGRNQGQSARQSVPCSKACAAR